MRRRQFLRWLIGGVCAGAWSGAQAHTPYNQWTVYRRKHLLIGCHKQDPRTYDLARRIVAVLESHLPAARARVARAPTAGRLASLLGTGQLDVTILGNQDVIAMSAGTGDFAPYGAIPLRVLLLLEEHALVCRSEMPDRHALLIADALHGSGIESVELTETDMPAPWHDAVAGYRKERQQD